MKSIVVEKRYAGRRIDRFVQEAFPALAPGMMFKAFRQKDIKVNGKWVKENHVVEEEDVVQIYIKDEFLTVPVPKLDIIYEDPAIIIVNKPQGLAVHSDDNKEPVNLLSEVRQYLSRNNTATYAELCHRLDRNTGGLVILAKTSAAHEEMLEIFKNHGIRKYYLCLVQGNPERKTAELRAYLTKNSNDSIVHISDRNRPGSVPIVTRYTVLASNREASLLEVELVTGRTHQIRAHLAHIGHPILGDGKYGSNSVNRSYGLKQQALWAYRLQFDFEGGGALRYLNGKAFETPRPCPTEKIIEF